MELTNIQNNSSGRSSPSFIPKRSLGRAVRRPAPFGFFMVFAVAVLLVTALFLGVAYGYRSVLSREISNPCTDPSASGSTTGCGLEERIERLRGDLAESTINEIKRFDTKLNRARDLFAAHNTLLPFLALLEDLTLHTIAFNSLTFNGDTINLAGLAKSYESIALQSEELAKNKIVKKFVFSDFTSPSDRGVPFRLTMVIDPTLTNYGQSLSPLELP